MATLKLPRSAPPRGRAQPQPRPPLRGRGAQPRPTLAQAERERREADRPAPAARKPAPAGRGAPHPERRSTATRAPEAPARVPLARAHQPPDARRPRPVESAAPERPAAGPAPGGADERPRLSKRMSELGLASRREADDWIAQGLVRVDGRVVAELGARVHRGQRIEVAAEAARAQSQRVTVLLHKPLGIVSGQAEDAHRPAVALVTQANRWRGDGAPLRYSPLHRRHLAPAGRLDIDSTGLLVLTQDGRVARALIGERSEIEKEYVVRVRWIDAQGARREFGDAPLMRAFPAARLGLLRHGLALDGRALRPAKVSWQNEETLRFVLREGRQRQIRRMCEQVGLAVVALRRVRIGRITLGELPEGQWRYLQPFESF